METLNRVRWKNIVEKICLQADVNWVHFYLLYNEFLKNKKGSKLKQQKYYE